MGKSAWQICWDSEEIPKEMSISDQKSLSAFKVFSNICLLYKWVKKEAHACIEQYKKLVWESAPSLVVLLAFPRLGTTKWQKKCHCIQLNCLC